MGDGSLPYSRVDESGLIRPAYVGLKNNVSTVEMEMQSHAWNPGTEEFILHNFLADYIQDAARANDVEKSIQFNTRVQRVRKVDERWRVTTSKLVGKDAVTKTETSTKVGVGLVVRKNDIKMSAGLRCRRRCYWTLSCKQNTGHRRLGSMEESLS